MRTPKPCDCKGNRAAHSSRDCRWTPRKGSAGLAEKMDFWRERERMPLPALQSESMLFCAQQTKAFSREKNEEVPPFPLNKQHSETDYSTTIVVIAQREQRRRDQAGHTRSLHVIADPHLLLATLPHRREIVHILAVALTRLQLTADAPKQPPSGE